jgi:hypothetical protein
MSDDYGNASFRKSKNDKKLKRKNRVYKRGGKYRGIEFKKE